MASPAPPTAASTWGSLSEQSEVTLEVDRTTITGRLDGSSTTQDLVAQLPLTLRVFDDDPLEKVADLPRTLSTDGAPPSADPEVDDLGSCASPHRVVFCHDDVGSFSGMIPSDRLDHADMQLVARRSGDFSITLRPG